MSEPHDIIKLLTGVNSPRRKVSERVAHAPKWPVSALSEPTTKWNGSPKKRPSHLAQAQPFQLLGPRGPVVRKDRPRSFPGLRDCQPALGLGSPPLPFACLGDPGPAALAYPSSLLRFLVFRDSLADALGVPDLVSAKQSAIEIGPAGQGVGLDRKGTAEPSGMGDLQTGITPSVNADDQTTDSPLARIPGGYKP
jgi:hypothetical protein